MAGKITIDSEVTTSELAVVLGLTGRRIRQLSEDGVLEKVKDGKFILSSAVQKYIAFVQSKSSDASKTEKEKQDAEVSIKKAKAIVSVLEAKELQGKMHRSEDVAAMTEDLIYSIRAMLISLPGRLAIDAAEARTPAEASEVVRKEVYKIMKELSEYKYDPQKYEERVRERMSWSEAGSDAGADGDDE